MTEKQKMECLLLLLSSQHKKRLPKEYPHYVDCTSKRSFIGDINEEALFADGFDNAIVGYDASSFCVVYDYDKCLKVLMERDDMSYPDAHEFMEFNVVGAYVGDFTPIFVHSLV